jgi:hypothetical protein
MTTSNWTPPRSARWIWLTLGSVVLISCCFWSGLIWMLPGLPNAWANRLDYVQGKTELLIPAERRPSAGLLSPDGRRLLISWMQDDQVQIVVWDLASNQQRTLDQYTTYIRWIDAEHLVIIGEEYQILNVLEWSTQPLIDQQQERGNALSLEQLETQVRDANQSYLFDGFAGASSYVLILRTQAQWSLYNLGYGEYIGVTRQALEQWLTQMPLIHVPQLGWGKVMGTNDRVYSHNGQYYTTREGAKGDARVVIYTREGVKVAEAAKGGWGPAVLGWAHDSSGVYFQQWISGSSATVLMSAKPLFKLSPLTPEEARWAAVQQGGAWGGALLALGGVGYVVVRRRRARR